MRDPYPEFSTKKDLFDRPSVRVILFVLIPGMIFALVSAAIRVSEYGIDHTILVFGDKTWAPSRPIAIRVSLVADDGRFFVPEKITAFLERNGTRHLLFNDAVGDRGDAVAVNMEVPKVAPGPYTLELDIRFDNRRRKITVPIAVAVPLQKERLAIPRDSEERRFVDEVRKGARRIRLFTEDRGAPTGIGSTAFLRVLTPDAEPVEMPLSLSIQRGPFVEKQSDRLGLTVVALRPTGLDAPITIDGAASIRSTETPDAGETDAGARETSATLFPNVVYSGISLTIHTPIAAAGHRVKVSIEQVASGGPVYANLFHGGQWVQGTSGFLSGDRAVMAIRPEAQGLHRLQVATAAIGAGDGVAVRHFYVLAPNETPADGLRKIVTLLKDSEDDRDWAEAVLRADLSRGGFDVQKAAAFALSRLYRGHRHPPQLISSRLEDDKELTAFKTKFQRMMMLAIIALGLGVCCFIGLFALAAHKRQQRISRMIMEEIDDDATGMPNDWTTLTGYRSTGRVIMQGAILFFIVLGAFVAIALLVDTLTWSA